MILSHPLGEKTTERFDLTKKNLLGQIERIKTIFVTLRSNSSRQFKFQYFSLKLNLIPDKNFPLLENFSFELRFSSEYKYNKHLQNIYLIEIIISLSIDYSNFNLKIRSIYIISIKGFHLPKGSMSWTDMHN